MSINYTYNDLDARKTTLDPGEYTVRVVGYEFGVSGPGNDKLDLELAVIEEDFKLYDSIVFTPKAAWKMDTALKCFTPSKGLDLPMKGDAITIDSEFVEKYLKGAEGRVLTFNELYDGKDKTRIRSFLPYSAKGFHAGDGTPAETLQLKGEADEVVPF